jgi:hypothetical protein
VLIPGCRLVERVTDPDAYNALEKLIAARTLLRESLPNETMRSGVAMAGIPKTFTPRRESALAG